MALPTGQDCVRANLCSRKENFSYKGWKYNKNFFRENTAEYMIKTSLASSPEVLRQVEEVLSHITDQTIIASSQIIERASVRPRLRIMAEVHPEGNPHSTFYPQIPDGSFNLILQASPTSKILERELPQKIHGIRVFSIYHKRNGEHIVFTYSRQPTLSEPFS